MNGSGLPYDSATLRFYSIEAPVYAGAGKDGVSRYLHSFLDRLAPSSRILELGCGGGRDCKAMLERDFLVDPTDGVPEMALEAEARIGRPVRVMRFDELNALEHYDAVWANASLLHVPRMQLPQILSRIRRALKPGGLHFANYKAGGRDGRDSLGRYFNYLSLAEMHLAYAASGEWKVLANEECEGGGYEGGTGPWVAITLQRI
jgi:SAM-dependent methyltransferase